MQIAIRADASSVIGAGHVMRCLTLANAFARHGANITFLCRATQGNLIGKIKRHGFTVLQLAALNNEATHSSSKYSQQQDAQECICLLKNIKTFDLFIVDHYELNNHWQELLRANYQKLLVIDDLANRQHSCDFLLDQTIGRTEAAYSKLIPPYCQTLLGQRYMLLREEFTDKKAHILEQRLSKKQINHVLVTVGGMDPHNITLLILKGLLLLKALQPDLQVSVLLTSQAPFIKAINDFSSLYQWLTLHVDTENVAEVMENADIAIGASGSTAWERCCLALPTLSIILADNQMLVDQSLASIGACVSLGWYESITEELIVEQCQKLLKNRPRYNELAISANNVCDGEGTERVVQKILKELNKQTIKKLNGITISTDNEQKKEAPVQLRLATMTDCQQVYQWQSKPSLRQYFVTPSIPSLEEHTLWFSNTLANQHRKLYIICNKEAAVGSLRLDKIKEKLYELSILIAPEHQGKGIGLSALELLPQLVNNVTIIANVHIANKHSHKLFINANFCTLTPTSYRLIIEDNKIKPAEDFNQGPKIK